MSDERDTGFDSKTVVVNKDELEAQLLSSEAETVRELTSPLFDPEIEAILRETEAYSAPEREPVREYVRTAPPVREAAPVRENTYIQPEKTPSSVDDIIAKREKEKKKKNTRLAIIIGAAAVILIAVFFAVSLGLKSNTVSNSYTEAFEKAQSYFSEGDYDRALEYLRQAMSVEKTDECLLMMSLCYEAKYDYVNAIAILEDVKDKDDAYEKRLEQLQKDKEDYESGKIVVVCGKAYDVTETTLDLSDQGLKSGGLGELGKLTELTSLDLSGNKLTDIQFLAPLKNLSTLDLSNNDITNISALSRLKALRTLHLDKNDISDFKPLYELKSLSTLTICDIRVTDTQLEELKKALPDCLIFSDDAESTAAEIELGGKTFRSDVTELDLTNCKITDVSALSVCTRLTKLVLADNFIKDISPLVDIPGLKYLDLRGNYISDIRPLISMTELTNLDLGDNEISSVTALSELKALKELVLTKNKISDITPLAKLTELKTLKLEDNAALTLNQVEELKAKLPGCKITTNARTVVILGGRSFDTDTEHVDASGLDITDISPVSGFTRLKSLDIRGNSIKDLSPLYSLSGLDVLYISAAPYTEEQLTQLQEAMPECYIIIE